MNKKILCVDDDANILAGFKRSLRKDFVIYTAESGDEAIKILLKDGPFAVIVSDMQMPGTNGVKFLSLAKKMAPESVRIMLTGNADQKTAMDAVNEGSIFRFLTKPCSSLTLTQALNAALEQYRLIRVGKKIA